MISGSEIRTHHSDVFTFMHGNLSAVADFCDTPEKASVASLVFISTELQLATARERDPAILIVLVKVTDGLEPWQNSQTCYFSVSSVSAAMATLLGYFDRKHLRFTQWGARHPTAVVHPDARIGEGVYLSPYCVIGKDAIIGDGSLIGAHAVIENGAKLGANCVIHPHVFVGASCELGRNCEVHPHTTIGSDGFGYAKDPTGRSHKIRHLGNVIIGDDVEIGSNCAIDRATLTSTRIRSGTKLDNICHIAHNCDLGEDGFYTAGFMMGGSTTIGRGFATGGNSVVTAHITLGDHITLAGRSTVTHDVPKAGAYGGYPLQPILAAKKTLVSLSRLNEIRKNLHRVMKHLNLSSED